MGAIELNATAEALRIHDEGNERKPYHDLDGSTCVLAGERGPSTTRPRRKRK